MDTFAEQLVKKNLSSAEKFKRNMILAGSVILGGIAVALSAVLSYYYLFTGIVICAALIAGGFWFSKNTDVEYEYSITNGELDIDKIIAKRKRKHLLSVNAADFSAYGRYDEDTSETADDVTFILACDGSQKGYWYADFKSGKYGKSRLIFSPDEKIRSCIKPYLSSDVKRQILKEGNND